MCPGPGLKFITFLKSLETSWLSLFVSASCITVCSPDLDPGLTSPDPGSVPQVTPFQTAAGVFVCFRLQ